MGRNVEVEDTLYEEIKAIVAEHYIEYPNIKNFVNKALSEKIKAIKEQKKKEELGGDIN